MELMLVVQRLRTKGERCVRRRTWELRRLLDSRLRCGAISASGRTWLEVTARGGWFSTTVRRATRSLGRDGKLMDGFAGTLSYYRSQEEEGKASRGAISMSVARILPPGPDKLKFEISNKLGKSFPSFWLKGNRTSPPSYLFMCEH